MKRKTFAVVLILEIILCIAFLVFRVAIPNWFTTMTAVPFEQIGAMLRTLSLSGAIGNAAAIIFYVAICLIPIGVYFYLRKRGLMHGIIFYLGMWSCLSSPDICLAGPSPCILSYFSSAVHK